MLGFNNFYFIIQNYKTFKLHYTFELKLSYINYVYNTSLIQILYVELFSTLYQCLKMYINKYGY